MIAALAAALRALAAFLELRALSYLDDREDVLIDLIDDATEDIDRLRSKGDPHSQQRADYLRLRVAGWARQLEYLRARRPAPPARHDRPDP